jgi:outer membrane protein OmpA-like peptidoglycan-associated protein
MDEIKVSPIWVGYSDSLNLFFITFLAISLILMANIADTDVTEIQETFASVLIKTIGIDKLNQMEAEVLTDGTVRFNKPENQFDVGSSKLKEQFKKDLNDFIPLYIQVMNLPQFKGKINEIHIDGHTSAFWNQQTSEKDAYFLNMRLSQERTVNTLEFVLLNDAVKNEYDWYRKHMVSNGYSSSRPRVDDPSAKENQRVEFKVIIDDPRDPKQKPTAKKRKEWTINIEEK